MKNIIKIMFLCVLPGYIHTMEEESEVELPEGGLIELIKKQKAREEAIREKNKELLQFEKINPSELKQQLVARLNNLYGLTSKSNLKQFRPNQTDVQALNRKLMQLYELSNRTSNRFSKLAVTQLLELNKFLYLQIGQLIKDLKSGLRITLQSEEESGQVAAKTEFTFLTYIKTLLTDLKETIAIIYISKQVSPDEAKIDQGIKDITTACLKFYEALYEKIKKDFALTKNEVLIDIDNVSKILTNSIYVKKSPDGKYLELAMTDDKIKSSKNIWIRLLNEVEFFLATSGVTGLIEAYSGLKKYFESDVFQLYDKLKAVREGQTSVKIDMNQDIYDIENTLNKFYGVTTARRDSKEVLFALLKVLKNLQARVG